MAKQTQETQPLEIASEEHHEGLHVYVVTEMLNIQGFRFTFSNIRSTAGDPHADVTVETVWPSDPDQPERLIFGPTKQNLLTSSWRSQIAKPLREQQEMFDWEGALQEMISTTVLKERSLTGMTTFAQFERNENENAYLLEPFIASSGVTVMFGEGSVGKSTIAAGMALVVATAEPLWGVFPARHGNVMWCDFESDSVELFERIDAILRGFDLDRSVMRHEVIHYPLHGRVASMQHQMRKAVVENDVTLVVLDSIGMARGGDAIGAEDTIRMFRALRYLGVPVLALDHITKEDKRGKKILTPYGSVYTINAARLLWGIMMNEDVSTPDNRQVNLVNTKANRVKIQDRCGFRIEYESNQNHLIHTIKMDLNQGQWDEDKGPSTVDKIMDVMNDAPFEFMTAKRISLKAQVPEKTIKNTLTKLMTAGEIVARRLEGRGGPQGYRQSWVEDQGTVDGI